MNSKIHNLTVILFLFYFLSITNLLFSKSDSTELRHEDKLRIREAVRIANDYGDLVWKNFDSAPFAIILVTNDNEYLMNLPNPTDDFKSIGYDTIIGGEIFTRPRQFSNNMLATFPAVNGIPTIVVGQPEYTSRPTMDWIITIVHEHFHQLQYSQPDYYESVNALDLAGGDESGMWMLNYNFPYDNKEISEQYQKLTQSAKKTYLSESDKEFNINLGVYKAERAKFKSMLNDNDYKYFSFQLWQEGLARYTEIKIADKIKDIYKPSKELSELEDYISMESFYEDILSKLLRKADTQSLQEDGRVCFYTLGALEGLILDRSNPGWQDLYFTEKFYPEMYFSDN
ncbi:MAG: hypothetical protein KDD00_01185 [Ignavibacteriae bacterium]|nr:hypothetical protein [Ignavibacteriota bacterium]